MKFFLHLNPHIKLRVLTYYHTHEPPLTLKCRLGLTRLCDLSHTKNTPFLTFFTNKTYIFETFYDQISLKLIFLTSTHLRATSERKPHENSCINNKMPPSCRYILRKEKTPFWTIFHIFHIFHIFQYIFDIFDNFNNFYTFFQTFWNFHFESAHWRK